MVSGRSGAAFGGGSAVSFHILMIARLYGKAPLLLSDVVITSNHYGFNVTGESNSLVVVEASTEIVHWKALATNTLGSTALPFLDPSPMSFQSRFYRARFQ